jgi:hypothetical protein
MVIVQLIGPPVGCAQVNLQVSLNLITSAPYTVYIDQPLAMTLMGSTDQGFLAAGAIGYLSFDTLQLGSSCGQKMPNIVLHEEFHGPYGACGGSVNWAFEGPNTGWGNWRTSSVPSPSLPDIGEFSDTLGTACAASTCVPASQSPGPLQIPPAPLSIQVNSWNQQDFFVGSKDLGTGAKTVPSIDVFYTDHGRHALWNWTCPQP